MIFNRYCLGDLQPGGSVTFNDANIKNPNPAAAKVILDALGGPDGELGAANRYLSQRFTMPYNEVVGILTDIGREASEMFHSEATAFFDAFATV